MPIFNTGKEVIQAFMRSLDNTTLKGQAALDEAVRACSNFNGINDLINQFVSDCQNAPDGDSFLKDYCGIDLDNNDTGAISGYDAGSTTYQKTAESIVPEYGSMQNFTGSSFTVKGLTVSFVDKNYNSITTQSLSTQGKLIANGLYSWWIEQSLNLIEESYGSNFGFSSASSATVKDMDFYLTYGGSFLATTWNWSNYAGDVTRLAMDVNTYYYNSFTDSTNGDSDRGQIYLDRTLSHEMTHAVMAANIKNFNSLPQFLKEGMAELTHGIDDSRTNVINKLANSPYYLRASVSLNDTGTGNSDCYAGGYMLLRYLAKQASYGNSPSIDDNTIINYKSNTLVSGTSDAESILNNTSGSRTTILAGDGDDTIDNRGDYSYINAGAGNDSITSNINSNYGWYVTINGGLGNDTITGSTHADTFIYNADDGNDIITNYESNDRIQILSGAIDDTLISGNDVIVSVGSGSITLKNARNKTLNFIDGNGDTISVGGDDTLPSDDTTPGNDTIPDDVEPADPGPKLIYNYNKSTVLGGTYGNDTIDNRAGDVQIYAGDGDDSIYNSTNSNYTINNQYGYVTIDGGDGNDRIISNDPNVSLNGGAGNDSIVVNNWSNVTVRGGTGNDTIVGSTIKGMLYQYYQGDGNDVLVDYSDADTIQILSGSVDETQLSGSDMIIAVGTGSIRLKDANNKSLNLVNASGRRITLEPDPEPTISSHYFTNYNRNSVVSGTSGRDTIANYAGGAIMYGGAGNDSIYNSTNSYYTINSSYGYVTLDGGDGDDTIDNHDPYVSISGGAGNDLINVGTWRGITVRGGTGNDTINGSNISGMLYQYSAGDGYDVFFNYNNNDTIQILSGAVDSTLWSSLGLYISVDDSSSILLANVSSANLNLVDAYGNKISIGEEPEDDPPSYITNYNQNSIVSGKSGKDTIINHAGGAIIRGAGGNDSIYNSTSSSYTINNGWGYVTLDGGNGNDTIESHDPYTSISGGKGNDSIYVSGWADVTINGGAGNDTITNLGAYNVIQYKSGDGNDLIQGYNSTSTIRLNDNAKYSTRTSGNDVIVSVGSGKITLKGAVGKTINIVGSDTTTIQTGLYINNTVKNDLVNGSSGNDTIRNRAGGVTIRTGDGNDSIFNMTTANYTINSGWGYVTIDAGDGNDTITNSDPHVSINAGDGDDTIYNYSYSYTTLKGGAGDDTISGLGRNNIVQYTQGDGNDLIFGFNGDDTFHITDESNYLTLVSGSDIIISLASGEVTLKNSYGYSLNINGGIYDGDDTYSDSLSNYTSDTIFSGTSGNDKLKNYAGGVTIRAGDGNDSIYSSTDYSYTGGRGYGYVTIDGGKGKDTINSNDPNVSLNGGDGNDSININNWSYVTVRGGAGADTITNLGSYNLIDMSSVSGNDLVYGYDDNDTIRLIDGSSFSTTTLNNDVIVYASSSTMTLKNASGKRINIVNDNINYITNYIYGSLVSGTSGRDSIYNSTGGSWSTLNAGDGNDTIDNRADHAVLNGGAGDDSINSSRNSTYGWYATLNGGTGNDTLTGSNGYADVFMYKAGDGYDVITNYESYDTIRLTDGSSFSTTRSGDDVIVYVGSG
ncbi:MAG: hypothetical protein IJ668_04705, partial [Selenomonadaceae bacterium]|nr:hypothetical protein [Selenomonadaceae bacterium]